MTFFLASLLCGLLCLRGVWLSEERTNDLRDTATIRILWELFCILAFPLCFVWGFRYKNLSRGVVPESEFESFRHASLLSKSPARLFDFLIVMSALGITIHSVSQLFSPSLSLTAIPSVFGSDRFRAFGHTFSTIGVMVIGLYCMLAWGRNGFFPAKIPGESDSSKYPKELGDVATRDANTPPFPLPPPNGAVH